jgi:hypothetical protein
MASAPELMLTGLITASISVPTSLLLARMTFKFVRQPELKQALTDAVSLEKGKRQLDREAAIRTKVVLWSYPILEAAKDLNHRLQNICEHDGYLPLATDWDTRRPKGWSATHAYFMNSSIYLFGRYFAQVELLRWNLGLDMYPRQSDKDELFGKVKQVASALARWPAEYTKKCVGEDRQLFILDQQALGQAFFDAAASRPITYAEFLNKADELARYTGPLRAVLEDLSPVPEDNCRWNRMLSLRDPLAELEMECERLVRSVLDQPAG